MDHLEESSVIAFVQDKLDAEKRLQIEQHIDVCDECRQLVAALGASSSLFTPYAGTLEKAERRKELVPGPSLAPGDIVAGRYTIVRTLGKGGMGYVFLAKDNELHIDVALKMLRPELSVDDEQIRHLRREILAGRAISHPNACRIFDLGKDERFYFITMEYVAGKTLDELLRTGRFTVGQSLDGLGYLLSVVAAAHREGIVHRDLKPGNIMVEDSGRVKVMDFGLARDLNAESSHAGAVGTPAYWAPEQARGEPAGPQADVYAIGVIAYLLLSGSVSTQAITRRLDRVPATFRPWIAKCVAEDPAERYPDAGAAKAAFAQLRARAPTTKRYLPWAVVGAVAAAGTLWIALRSDDDNARPVTAAPPVVAPSTPADAASVVEPQAPVDAAIPDASSPADARKPERPRPRPDAGATQTRPDARAGSPLYE
jgi:predicted Ser/Thr protein kinase